MFFKKISTFILLLFLVLIVFGFVNSKENTFTENFKPCREPITYSINKIDDSFNISKAELVNIALDSEMMWEKKSSKDLFLYSPEESLIKINLIYNPEISDNLKNLGHFNTQIEENKDTYNVLYSQYENLSSKYNKKLDEYNRLLKSYDQLLKNRNSLVNDYNNDLKSYNFDVNNYNQYGGSNSQYNSLKNRGEELDKRYAELIKQENILYEINLDLEKKEREINSLAENINSLISVLNQIESDINFNITKSKELITPEVRFGEYITNYKKNYSFSKTLREINIYGFNSRGNLVLTIAHELGHSLGINHLDNENALMYPKLSDKIKDLTDYDINALNNICRSYEN